MGSISLFESTCEKILRFYSQIIESIDGLTSKQDSEQPSMSIQKKIIENFLTTINCTKPNLLLEIACMGKHNSYITDGLLKYIADPKLSSNIYHKLSILEIIVLTGNIELFKYFAQSKLIPNLDEPSAVRLIMACIYCDHTDFLEVLLNYFKIGKYNRCNSVFLLEAMKLDRWNIFNRILSVTSSLVLNAPINNSYLIILALYTQHSMRYLELLLQTEGINYNVIDQNNRTALHIACINVLS
jgi:ankyrin repeat protein